jgi:hypothetical protein
MKKITFIFVVLFMCVQELCYCQGTNCNYGTEMPPYTSELPTDCYCKIECNIPNSLDCDTISCNLPGSYDCAYCWPNGFECSCTLDFSTADNSCLNLHNPAAQSLKLYTNYPELNNFNPTIDYYNDNPNSKTLLYAP